MFWVEISEAYLKVFEDLTQEPRIWSLLQMYLKIINNFMEKGVLSRK